MDADYFRLLYDYAYWARDRLLKAGDGLSEDEYAKPNGFNYGSIRGILTHVLAAESGAIARWTEGPRPEGINQESLATIEALRERWRQEEAKLRPFLASLKDGELTRDIVTRRPTGEETIRPLYIDLTQIVNHGTQHRSEAAEALTMVGRSPGDLDFSVFYRERPGG